MALHYHDTATCQALAAKHKRDKTGSRCQSEVVKEPSPIEGFATLVHASVNDSLYVFSMGTQLFVRDAATAQHPHKHTTAAAPQLSALSAEHGQQSAPYSVDPVQKRRRGLLAVTPRLLKLRKIQDQALKSEYEEHAGESLTSEEVVLRFAEAEKIRLYQLAIKAKGFVEMRDIEDARLCPSSAGDKRGSFEIAFVQGSIMTLRVSLKLNAHLSSIVTRYHRKRLLKNGSQD